jgi:hypothetical protein
MHPTDRLWIIVAIENELLTPCYGIQHDDASLGHLPSGGTAMISEHGSTPVRMEPFW